MYLGLSRRGARVLALGWKDIGRMSHQEVKDLDREFLESNLKFSGFITISCPLKSDSKAVIKELLGSTHMVNEFLNILRILSSVFTKVSIFRSS